MSGSSEPSMCSSAAFFPLTPLQFATTSVISSYRVLRNRRSCCGRLSTGVGAGTVAATWSVMGVDVAQSLSVEVVPGNNLSLSENQDTEEDNELSFALTSHQQVLPCHMRTLYLCHNLPYTRWRMLWIPPLCKHGLKATLFGRNKQEKAEFYSQHLPVHFRGAVWSLPCWFMCKFA